MVKVINFEHQASTRRLIVRYTIKHFIFTVCYFLLPFFAFSQSLYKTPSGKKYHLAECRMVNNVSQKVTVDQVLQLGLEPCKICNPRDINLLSASSENKSKGNTSTVQCKGYTKNGTRCKHMTSIGNGYCFQHNPD